MRNLDLAKTTSSCNTLAAISHMYIDNSELSITKTRGLPLWRYMDLWKFLKLINSSKLFFPNIQLLGDQNEGKMPSQVFEYMKNHSRKNGKDDNFAQVYRDFFDKTTRKNGLILPWTASKTESYALWKIYAKDKLGVAIKTDIERLKNCFRKASEKIYIGEVKYFDNENIEYGFGRFSNYILKSKYYEFESEVRCITELDPEDNSTFKNIEVDLNELIDEVYISPFAEETGLLEIIDDLKSKKNLNFKIKISGINDTWL